MRDDEVRGVAALARLVLRGTTTRIAELHAGISGRAFDAIGPAIGPAASTVRTVHDVVSTAAYAGVRFGLGAGASAAGVVAALWAGDEPSAASRPRVDRTLALLNGTHGDLVARHAPGLAVRMAVRSEGRDVPLTTEGLSAAFPGASGRLAVFLHGLTEDEGAWCFRSERHHGEPGVTYGSLLQADLGLTPVFLRYSSGLHVSDNGRALDALLGELVAAWPVPVRDVVLVGHSMGGLVARSALHQAADRSAWVPLVRDTVTLGTPHLGAPLERGVHALTARMARLPETRPLAAVLNSRSVGIKDLRHGTLVESDWTGRDLDAPGTAERTAVPLADGARHFVVVGTVAPNPRGPVGALLGDLMVSARSAQGDTGREDRLAFPPDAVALVGGLHHLALLNHPRVYERIRQWLVDRPPTDPAAPPRPPAPTRRAAGPSA